MFGLSAAVSRGSSCHQGSNPFRGFCVSVPGLIFHARTCGWQDSHRQPQTPPSHLHHPAGKRDCCSRIVPANNFWHPLANLTETCSSLWQEQGGEGWSHLNAVENNWRRIWYLHSTKQRINRNSQRPHFPEFKKYFMMLHTFINAQPWWHQWKLCDDQYSLYICVNMNISILVGAKKCISVSRDLILLNGVVLLVT